MSAGPPPPECLTGHSVAVLATSSSGPPSHTANTARLWRQPARRGRPQRGALIRGAPTHPQMAGIGIRWPCVPPRRLAPPLSCPKRPFLNSMSRVGGARSAARSSWARPPTPRWLESAFGGRACHLDGWYPLSVSRNGHFLTPCRASRAPAAQRAELGRAHPPPDGWNRCSVAVRATLSTGPPSQLPETAISERHVARRGRPQRGALIWGAPSHPHMAGIGIRWPCVPPRRLAPS